MTRRHSPVIRSSVAAIMASATLTMAVRRSATRRWERRQEAFSSVSVSLWYLQGGKGEEGS